jgi:hypothetical protein
MQKSSPALAKRCSLLAAAPCLTGLERLCQQLD